ncbi:voltage-gated monoatomic cation channel TMEM109 [Archocentrus centrarchus]|uniref:voltage-gated monoatomic cation channel TMEM109 n=1 Tax=Archocentrus centrarchus TaxID=63155 RepID=UPI0011E9D471|nr:uncharacterized protein LOC115776792 [Archocentrus centrarchus]
MTAELQIDGVFLLIFKFRLEAAATMTPRTKRKVFSGLCFFSVFVLSVVGETAFESPSGAMQELRTALCDFAVEGRTYLGRLVGEQTLLSVQKAFSQVLAVAAGSVAAGLNVLLQYITQFLQASGIQVALPISKVTPDGLLFVAQWVLIALICYWLISLAFRLVASTLMRALWLLKVGVALTCFGLILSDHHVGTEMMAIRLAVLLCVCAMLGVGTWRGSSGAEKTAHLEEQVKILERRLKDMEKWTRTEEK